MHRADAGPVRHSGGEECTRPEMLRDVARPGAGGGLPDPEMEANKDSMEMQPQRHDSSEGEHGTDNLWTEIIMTPQLGI